MQNMSFHVLDKICKFCGALSRLQKLATVESFTSENENEYKFCPRGLVHCFRQCLGAHLICYSSLKKASFARIILVFHVFSRKKSVLRQPWSSIWMTHLKKTHDFWWVGSAKLTFVNLVLEKTTSLQNVVVHGQPTKSFPSALLVADNYTCGLWPIKQTRTPLRSRSRI